MAGVEERSAIIGDKRTLENLEAKGKQDEAKLKRNKSVRIEKSEKIGDADESTKLNESVGVDVNMSDNNTSGPPPKQFDRSKVRSFGDVKSEDILAMFRGCKVEPISKSEQNSGPSASEERALKFYKDKTGLEYKYISAETSMIPVHIKGHGRGFHLNFFASPKEADSPVELFFVEEQCGKCPKILRCDLLNDKPISSGETLKLYDVYHPPGMECLECPEYAKVSRSGKRWI